MYIGSIVVVIVDTLLAAFIAREVIQFVPHYRQLKQALANGDTEARMRIYRRVLSFEWISALLALIALGFDWSKLNPKFLDLGGTPLIQSLSRGSEFTRGVIGGVLAGVTAGTVGLVIARIRANRRGAPVATSAPILLWRKLLPDFTALLPGTGRERLLWAVVAVSAGICEEVVFRGWLLSTLHNGIGVSGTALIVAGAIAFGLAHAYQGISGMILTAFAGAFFCVLYVATGSLLAPIVLHIVIDARFALLPPRIQKSQASYA
jgi:membrane protease YdiL (CAAX protease family)